MTGIKERRWASEDEETSDLAYKASLKQLRMQVLKHLILI